MNLIIHKITLVKQEGHYLDVALSKPKSNQVNFSRLQNQNAKDTQSQSTKL